MEARCILYQLRRSGGRVSVAWPATLGGLDKQAAIKTAARRLLALAPAEPKIELYCRGFRVTIERGEFDPPA